MSFLLKKTYISGPYIFTWAFAMPPKKENEVL